jgi:hypothetical protein
VRSRALLVALALVALVVAPAAAEAHGGRSGGGGRGGSYGSGGRGGYHRWGGGGRYHYGGHKGGYYHRGYYHRPNVFVTGFWNPFPYRYPYYRYYAPYPLYYPPYPVYYPPPDESGWGAPPGEVPAEPDAEKTPPAASDEAARASYGLVQLRGVPDGAAVELDGRFWLTATSLDERWLALPDGEHTLSVRVGDADPVVRRIEVRAGKTQVVRFGELPRPPA